jgi:hypothetical protein
MGTRQVVLCIRLARVTELAIVATGGARPVR